MKNEFNHYKYYFSNQLKKYHSKKIRINQKKRKKYKSKNMIKIYNKKVKEKKHKKSNAQIIV